MFNSPEDDPDDYYPTGTLVDIKKLSGISEQEWLRRMTIIVDLETAIEKTRIGVKGIFFIKSTQEVLLVEDHRQRILIPGGAIDADSIERTSRDFFPSLPTTDEILRMELRREAYEELGPFYQYPIDETITSNFWWKRLKLYALSKWTYGRIERKKADGTRENAGQMSAQDYIYILNIPHTNAIRPNIGHDKVRGLIFVKLNNLELYSGRMPPNIRDLLYAFREDPSIPPPGGIRHIDSVEATAGNLERVVRIEES